MTRRRLLGLHVRHDSRRFIFAVGRQRALSGAEAVALGVLQGVTEFLPVSSSGHLVVGKALLHVQEAGIALEIFLHLGTLMSILVVFYRDVGRLLAAAGRILGRPLDIGFLYMEDKAVRFVVLVLAGSVPAGLVGLTGRELIEPAFSNVRLVGGMLMITAIILFVSRWGRERGVEIGFKIALMVGIAQSAALLPGISRAGLTISTALLLGASRDDSVRFSLFLAIPAIAGAALLQTVQMLSAASPHLPWESLLSGTVVAFAVGCAAIWALRGLVRRGQLSGFSYYCATLAVITWTVVE